MKNRPVVIWDIDGVLADDRIRAQAFLAATDQFEEPRSLELRPECDWEGYYGGIPEDQPHEDMVELFKFMHWNSFGVSFAHPFEAHEAKPVFLTGRGGKYREETCEWLREHVHPHAGSSEAPLYMRTEGSRLTNAQGKAKHLKSIREVHGNPIMAFEDNDDTAQFYRDQGIRCLQVARAVPAAGAYKA